MDGDSKDVSAFLCFQFDSQLKTRTYLLDNASALAASIKSGRVTLPCSAQNLQRVVGLADGELISKKLDELVSSSISGQAICACLEIARAMISRPPLEDFS